jgi:hypothetical protein
LVNSYYISAFVGLIEPKGFALELPEENLIVLKELKTGD